MEPITELVECPIHGLTDLSDHIGGKPCTAGKPSGAKKLSDLPIFGWGVGRRWTGHGSMSHHACGKKGTPHEPHRFRRFLWGMGAVYWTWCDGE